MASREVDQCDSLGGTLNGVLHDPFTLKQHNCTMKVMSTYRGLMVPKNEKLSKRIWKERGETKTTTFQYTELLAIIF